MFGFGSGSGLVQMIAIKLCIEHFGLSRTIFFRKEKFLSNFSQLRRKNGRFHLPPRAAFFLASVFSTFFNMFWSVCLHSWNYLLCFGVQIVTWHSHKLSLLNFHECLLYRNVEMQKTSGLYRQWTKHGGTRCFKHILWREKKCTSDIWDSPQLSTQWLFISRTKASPSWLKETCINDTTAGQIVNISGLSRAGMKKSRARVGYG
jgi:hypothetical protein